jgi:hypothetical protein
MGARLEFTADKGRVRVNGLGEEATVESVLDEFADDGRLVITEMECMEVRTL